MEVLLAAALLLLPLLLLPYYLLYLSRAARLTASLPGPKPKPLIGNAFEFGSNTVDIMAALIRLWRQYGNVYRLWIGPKLFVVVGDVNYVEHFLTSNVNIRKNMSYKFLSPWLGDGLLTSTGSKWKHRRKILTPTFHFKILEQFVDVFNKHGNTLVEKLRKQANGPEFDIYNYITVCTLDIICETAMGVEMKLQEAKNPEYFHGVKELADVVMTRTFNPWYFSDLLFSLTPLARRQVKALKILHGTTKDVIRKRRVELLKERADGDTKVPNEDDTGRKKRMAFLDLLLQYSREGASLTDEDIREEVDTFMFEGHDTTSSALSFCLLLLSQHPDAQEKVYNEQKEIFGDSDRDATYQDLQDMKYLECVLKETQRMYPTVPFFLRELDVEVKLDGLHVPAGTNIMFCPHILHHNPELFPEPDKFDPERFNADNVVGRHPYAFIPFSAGPRNCIGQKFAVMEMKSTVSKVIRSYRLTPSSKDVVLSAELVLRSWGGIFVKIEKRSA